MTEHTGRIAALMVAALVLGAAIVCVLAIDFSPGFDAFGWLVWGHQLLFGHLTTTSAPSWKPLPFIFTVPYALAGSAQPRLWLITSTAFAFAAPVFGARAAYRLCGPCPGRPYAPAIGAVFAGCGVLGLGGYWHLITIGSSDPMVVALCLAAIDFHLGKHPRIAFAALVLAGLGRPEVWPFLGLYALWLWRAHPSMRIMLAAGVALIPLSWFAIPAFTSKSPFMSGDLALGFKAQLHGNKLTGTVRRFLDDEPWPMHVAWLAAVVLAAVRRDRTELVLAGAAVVWVAVEIAFALHGWPASPRYLLEPAAVLTVLAGAEVGRAFAIPSGAPLALRIAGPVVAGALALALLPTVSSRLREAHRLALVAQATTARIDRLRAIVVADGGARGILACGLPVTHFGDQSTLAWEIGVNVGNVGHKPPRAIRSGRPIVLFTHDGARSWEVRPIHIEPSDRPRCLRMRITTDALTASASGPLSGAP
jgi:hypothetical protein